MRFRRNIVLQYSIATFIIILGVSVALGITLASRITDYQLRSHIRLFPELIGLTVKNNPQVYEMFKSASGGTVSPDTEGILRGLFGLGTIFRVKVWSRDGTIVWSDSRKEIGQKFPDDPPLVEALTGRAAYELGESENEEDVIEKHRGALLQVYTPVMKNGTAVGVVELYEANSDLFAQIARNTLFVEGLVAAAGLLLYLALFAIFFRANQSQKRTDEEKNRGHGRLRTARLPGGRQQAPGPEHRAGRGNAKRVSHVPGHPQFHRVHRTVASRGGRGIPELALRVHGGMCQPQPGDRQQVPR